MFLLDKLLLDPLPRTDRRVAFILSSLMEVDQSLRTLSGKSSAGLIVLHGHAPQAIASLARELQADAVFCARDYEPQAIARDAAVSQTLQALGCSFQQVKDHVVFEQREILTQSGTPYTVFTPYLRNWMARLATEQPPLHTPVDLQSKLAERPPNYRHPVPSLEDIGFTSTLSDTLSGIVSATENNPTLQAPMQALGSGMSGAHKLLDDFLHRIDQYHAARDFPAVRGPSYLGVHLRFGTVSIRTLVRLALQKIGAGEREEEEKGADISAGARIWLQELAWRDFYFQILANFPHVATSAFKPAYDGIVWEEGALADRYFDAWCNGRTGYPLVDAAMLQLRESGYMHNRLRMVSGSFLVKHLGVDWRRGEQFFALHLNDFDLASNNGGWQWVSSTGCDAQPYFRIFHPVRQSEKFDPQGKFIRRYLPQLAALDNKSIHAPWAASADALARANVVLGHNYPQPIVDHATAREQTLNRYAAVRQL